LNNYSEDIEYYKQALALDSNIPNGYLNLGNSYAMTNNAEEAIISFKRQISIKEHVEATKGVECRTPEVNTSAVDIRRLRSLAQPVPDIGLAAGPRFVEPSDWRGVRRVLHELRIFRRLLGDLQHRLAEAIQLAHRLGLRGLGHDRFRHDEWEVDRRRVHPEIEQPLEPHGARR